MYMKEKEKQRINRKKAFLSVLISFVLISAIYHIILFHDLAADKERYRYIAKNQSQHIITTIDCVMSRTNTLITMVKKFDGDTDWFDDIAEDLYNSTKAETGVTLKNFALAPDGVVSDVYPLEGNESFVGFDFLDLSREGNLEAKEAYEKGGTVLTNPFELVQGGIGMGGRAPVMLETENGRTLWGLVTVTIDFDNLVEVINLDNLQGMGVDYSLSYIDADGNEQFMCGERKLGSNTVRTQFKVRNLTWVLEVKPSKGWISAWRFTISVLIILTLSCLDGLLIYMMLQLHENNAILQNLSVTDVLTGCYNRRAYEEKIHEMLSHNPDDDCVYVSADVNGLKQTNDTLGHLAGDELLSGAAECLQKSFGPYGSIYRIGGDEFAALICVGKEALDGIMEQVKESLAGWKGHSVNEISVSFGYAAHRDFPEMNIEELGKTADMKMYDEKNAYYQTHDRRRR